jgi:hypothetical protein
MIIDDAIKTAASGVNKIGPRAGMVLFSVLLPGFLIVTEVFSFYYLQQFGTDIDKLKNASDVITRNFVFGILLILVVLALSFAAGFISREIAFAVSDCLLRRSGTSVLRLIPYIKQNINKTVNSNILHGLRIKYSNDNIDRVLLLHPIFDLYDCHDELRTVSRREPDFYVRNYCKLWLKIRVPNLAVEYMETEINIFLSLIIPIAGIILPFLGLRLADSTIWEVSGIVLVAITAALLMMVKINDGRRYETEQALVNFFFAHWENLAKPSGLRAADKPTRTHQVEESVQTVTALTREDRGKKDSARRSGTGPRRERPSRSPSVGQSTTP